MKKLDVYRRAIELTLRKFHLDPGDYYIFENEGERLVWCHPDNRSAFITAGIPERDVVSVAREELRG